MEQSQEYFEVLKLIGLFQTLEATLKYYIGANYQYINLKVGEDITFKYSFDDLDNFPLERLLTIFAKLNSDSELQRRLNVLKTWRNLVAHKSMLLASTSMSKELKVYTAGYESNPIDFPELGRELEKCIQLLADELQTLLTLLKACIAKNNETLS